MFEKLSAFVKRHINGAGQGSGQPPPPATPTPAPAAKTPDAPTQDMPAHMRSVLDELFAHGLKAAEDADELSENPNRRAVLQEYAVGRVSCLYLGPFDPINNPGDAAIKEAIETAKGRERKLENDLLRAAAARNEAQRNVPADQPPPRPSLLVMGTAITGFALAYGASINELPILKGFDDDGTALIVSFGVGGALGCLCVCSMFGLKIHDANSSATWSPKPENPAWQLIAGIVMIVAFGLVRSYAATGPRDWMITLGLMGVDLAVLMYAKGEAARHRQREDIWAQRCDARHHKLLAAEVSEAQHALIEADFERAKAERRAGEARLEARLRFYFDFEAIARAAIAAVDEGYFFGIDKVNGRFAAGRLNDENDNAIFNGADFRNLPHKPDFGAANGHADGPTTGTSRNGHR